MLRLAALSAALLLGCNPAPQPAGYAARAPSPSGSPRPSASSPAPGAPSPAPGSPGAASTSTSRRIADLVAARPASGQVTFTGHAAKIYLCPPCPPGAACKPCMGDNVVLCDADRRIVSYGEVDGTCVMAFGARAELERLALGKRYEVVAKVLPRSTTSAPHPDLELVRASPVP